MSDNPVKKVLIVKYSQTGQLSRVASSIAEPLINSSAIDVKTLTIEPEKQYPFPWDFFMFLDVFPESVYLDPPRIRPLNVNKDERFDLIILAYQVWFLSPSLPITAFLKSETGQRLLQDRPVITLIGCRNMWIMAQEAVKKLLKDANARLIDNVVLVDQGSSIASFVTTPRWLLSGKKDPFWGFPAAGIAEEDIKNACRFGLAIEYGLLKSHEKSGESLLHGLKAVNTDYGLIQSEKVGYRSFRIWGKLLRNIGKQNDPKRKPVLILYLVFLILMILTVVPINIILKRISSPLFRTQQENTKIIYELPSGSGIERMDDFKCQ